MRSLLLPLLLGVAILTAAVARRRQLAVHQLGSIERGPPSTDREFTSTDFLQRRMARRAVAAASVLVLAGGAAELLTRQRAH